MRRAALPRKTGIFHYLPFDKKIDLCQPEKKINAAKGGLKCPIAH
jgi:hypothetical protein